MAAPAMQNLIKNNNIKRNKHESKDKKDRRDCRYYILQ